MTGFKFDLKELTIGDKKHTLTIEGIHFCLNSPERSIALLGDSGMGKTTIFRSLLSKYVQKWSLHSSFRFDCVHKLNDREFSAEDIQNDRRIVKIGFATQFPYFFESQTVFENVFAPLKWKKLKLDRKNKEEYLKKFGLDTLTQKSISILSGGQRQLANIARMLVVKPQLAIIDECFSSMDEKMAYEKIKFILDYFNDIIFLVTSHRQSDVEAFGGKVIRLKKEQHRSGKFYVTQEDA